MRTAEDLLAELAAVDESHRIEAKLATQIDRSVMETVCAFSNEPGLGGGYLLLGVAPKVTRYRVAYSTHRLAGRLWQRDQPNDRFRVARSRWRLGRFAAAPAGCRGRSDAGSRCITVLPVSPPKRSCRVDVGGCVQPSESLLALPS
jgi:hypothetical protein